MIDSSYRIFYSNLEVSATVFLVYMFKDCVLYPSFNLLIYKSLALILVEIFNDYWDIL